jgi:Domain of unknown function (DUF6265)
MRNCIWIAALLLAPGSAVATTPDLLPAWLTGAWSFKNGADWGDEYWTPPRGGIMIGAARTGKGEKLIVWESTRIAYDEDGKLAFWAMPRGVPATKFTMVSRGPQEIVFANTAHDYPQRVRYWRDGKRLKAEISMIDGSKAFRFDYLPMGGK